MEVNETHKNVIAPFKLTAEIVAEIRFGSHFARPKICNKAKSLAKIVCRPSFKYKDSNLLR